MGSIASEDPTIITVKHWSRILDKGAA